MRDIDLKKFFLSLLIGSVGLSALLGIVVVVIGNFGDFETRVLLTTFTITCTSILGLACGAGYESGRFKIMPLTGIGLSVIAAVLWFVIIWGEPRQMPWGFVRSLLSVTVVAIALSLATLVSLARLDRKFVWALYTHYISLAGLTGILISLIWFDEALEVDLTLRVLGVFAIIAGAMTIMIPVFHRLSRVQDEAVWIDDEILELERRIEELKIKRESLKKPEEEGGAEAP